MLENFESVLEQGLLKICRVESLLGPDPLPDTVDVTSRWDEEYLQAYVADAVENFNSWPEAALCFAAYLGMGVAHLWDEDWEAHKAEPYEFFYGSRLWDDMDDHIVQDILHLDDAAADKLARVLDSCALAALGLIRHEGIEAGTAEGFHALVRSYCVMYRLGAGLELCRLGYRKVRIK